MKFILALDQGTTSSRAIVFDRDGRIQSVAQREFPQIYPKPGWVEHNPDDIWRSQRDVAAEALAKAKLSAGDIAAIGISNQRETTLIWERATGRPIHNAIVWQDRRTADICDRLKADGLVPLLRTKTGLVADAYFSGSKIQWLLDHVPDARARAEAGELAFGTVDSWLIWNLTGGRTHIVDHSNASRTLLYNLRTNDWDDELLKIFRVPRAILPQIADSSGIAAEASIDEFQGIPIAGIAGDQQAALFGQMCVEPGMAKCTYGTGCFILLNIGDQPTLSRHDLVTTVAWRIDGRTEYAQEGSVFIGGAAVQWLRDGLGIIQTSADAEKLAASVEDNGGVYFVPAFVGLGAPHWDQRARGAIVGITRGVTAGHLARAALEGIAFQVMDVLDAMRAGSPLGLSQIRVDGGASANDLLMQFQSDILGIPVVRPVVLETTAMGAAFLAGLAVGYWEDRQEISGLWSVNRRFEPIMPSYEVEQRRLYWEQALQRSKGWESGS